MGAHVHHDTHVYRDTRVDADSQPERHPAAGPEATEVIANGYANPGSGDANSDDHAVTPFDCTAGPHGVSDTGGPGGRGP
jgi:hypothetical protein